MKKRIHQIELFLKYPYDVQNEWLRKLLTSASKTEWGKKYSYHDTISVNEYRNRVPISDYDTIKPYIIRLRQGEQNLLWHSDIRWFAKSSGTSEDKSKFIPVSSEAIEDCHFKGGKDMLSIYCNNNPDTLIFDGRGLAMGGSHQISEFNNESYYGDLSAIIIQNLPFWAEFIRVPNLSIALMDKWEAKIEKMAKTCIPHNVTNITGVPSWTLVLMKRILEITGKKNILEVWPNLELYIHGGVSFVPYKEQYAKLFPSADMKYLETYNASEGFFGIQDRNYADDMLLMLDYGIYYEFMPLEETHNDQPKTLTLNEVNLNTNYALIITTNAGLWRYRIGDTVMFTSLNPHRIKITGRIKHFINVVGEEIIIDNTDKALAHACNKTGAVISDYTVSPVFVSDTQASCHEWLIEFEIMPDNLDYFAELVDNALKSINSDYEAKRYHSLALAMPVFKVLPKGTFYNWMKKKGKLGGQNKVPRLANDRRYSDEILNMVHETLKKN